MLASTGALPAGDLSWEPKMDGWRTQARIDGAAGELRLLTRSGHRIEDSVPELAGLVDVVGAHRIVLDGELVAGDGGPDSFYCLGGRLAASTPRGVARARARAPLTLVAFDVLWLDGELLVGRSYRDRRCILENLALAGEHWVTTPAYADGEALLAACDAIGVEGAVAKAVDSVYVSRRSSAWVKRKSVAWQTKHAARRQPGWRRAQEAQVAFSH